MASVEPGFAKGEVAVIVGDEFLTLIEAMDLASRIVAQVNDLLPFWAHEITDHPERVVMRAPLRRASDR